MKKLLSIVMLAFAVTGLAACSSKDANGIPNKLQDKYTGYSENPGDNSAFSEGGSTLIFDKKNRVIKNKSEDKKTEYTVVPEDSLNPEDKGAFNKHKSEYGKDYFIITTYKKYKKGDFNYVYVVSLSNGGKEIKIDELENGVAADDYLFHFAGKAE